MAFIKMLWQIKESTFTTRVRLSVGNTATTGFNTHVNLSVENNV